MEAQSTSDNNLMGDIREKILIRDAYEQDSPLIAWVVLSAIGYEESSAEFQSMLPSIIEICKRTDTLYSWKRTRVATIDGTAIGCLISYDGALYENLRPLTWKMFAPAEIQFTDEDFKANAIETKAGEYYLDSMAIKKAFRGAGIGKVLLKDGIRIAKEKGFKRVTLIAESGAHDLRKYYSSLGFKEEDKIIFFGEDYTRMALEF